MIQSSNHTRESEKETPKMTIERNEMIEVLDDRTSKLSITYFQQITTFFHLDTLGGMLPWLRP
jgi:hypothetical protein